jgi:hypothetical protein
LLRFGKSSSLQQIHFSLALDNGLKPAELSEIVTHLAFYSGWANAMSAVAVAKDIFRARGIGIGDLPAVKEKLLPLNEEAESQRASQVSSNFRQVSPGLVQNTPIFSSASFGCGLRWLPGTAVLLLSAP